MALGWGQRFWACPEGKSTGALSRPHDSAEPRTPIEALLQSSRPLPVPPLRCSLFHSAERGTFSAYSNYVPLLSPATIPFRPVMLLLAFVLIIVSLLW